MTTRSRILVTGASGFIGQHLVARLAEAGHFVRAAARQPVVFEHANIEGVAVGDMSRAFAADYLIRGCDTVIHAAGMAHSRAGIPDALYTAINVDATRELARAARAAKVKRFVLMSSVRAQTGPKHDGVITEATPPAPTDAYGRSKLAAEGLLPEVFEGAQTRWTVLRPVLVYGPGVKGNLAELIRLADTAAPLPFGLCRAKRSMVSIVNLAGAVEHVISGGVDGDGVYLVADDAPVTLAQIITALRKSRNRAPMLLPVPQSGIDFVLRASGRGELADRLTGSLVVDAQRLRETGWRAAEAPLAALAGRPTR